MARSSNLSVLACSAAVCLAGLVYLNSLNNPFVYDDARSILNNRSLTDPTFESIVLQNVSRPLVNVSYFVDHTIWGLAPFGYHLTSVLLHMLNVALLFLFTRGVVMDRFRDEGPERNRRATLTAAVAATLFAVHPMMTEAVGYVSGRSDVLAGTFNLLSFVAVRRWLNTNRSRWLIVALAAFFLALSAKETAFVMAGLFLYYILLVRSDPQAVRRRHVALLCVPVVAIAIVGATVRLGLFVFVEYAGRVGWQWRFGIAEIDVSTRYLALMIAPVGQTIFHGVPATTSFLEPRAIVALSIAALYVALVVLAARRRSIAGFGLAWFAVMLLPSAVLVLMNRGEPMAERRVYFASAGLFLAAGHGAAVVWAALESGRRFTRIIVATAAAVLIMGLAGRTIIRNAVWSSPIQLWAEAVEHNPEHWFPQLVLGESLHEAGRHTEAIHEYRRALQSGAHVAAVYEHLGLCQLELRHLDDAVVTFTALATVDPKSAAATNGLATVALLKGDLDAARRGYLESLDLDPRSIEARRGIVLVEERSGGRSDEALRRCEEIALLAPGTPGIAECIRRHQPAAAP
jgi:tetratricopeptide (TPR) repeat protein